ncbi:hypothetical protein [Caldivirga sp. UBA161]|uniref:hypothetical protein n=1 Tax=Caldivirga sp. UBA161 TaxID=1915569 RepID=UPI0025C2DC01|nr:hypothetical protein [Caldivirga sp. UBA161]
MDLSELISLLTSKGVDYLVSQLPSLIASKQVSREDIELILLYSMSDNIKLLRGDIKAVRDDIKALRDDVKTLGSRIDNMHRDLAGKLDFIINQLQVLNSNISATYELTSKVMAKLMELSGRYPPT